MKDVWNAMADPTRRQILTMLQKKDMTAGEIVEQFDISGATISHHLKILREAGLIVEFLGLSGDEKAEKLKKAIIEEAPKYGFTLGKEPTVFYKDKKYKVFFDVASWTLWTISSSPKS